MSEFYSANEVVRISRRIPQFQLVKLSVSTGKTPSFKGQNSEFQGAKLSVSAGETPGFNRGNRG